MSEYPIYTKELTKDKLFDKNHSYYEEMHAFGKNFLGDAGIQANDDETDSILPSLLDLAFTRKLNDRKQTLVLRSSSQRLLARLGYVRRAHLDLVNLRGINNIDMQAGDNAIRDVVLEVHDKLPENCLIVRLGGDEFGIYTKDSTISLDKFTQELALHNNEKILTATSELGIEVDGNAHYKAKARVKFSDLKELVAPKKENLSFTQLQEILSTDPILNKEDPNHSFNRYAFFEKLCSNKKDYALIRVDVAGILKHLNAKDDRDGYKKGDALLVFIQEVIKSILDHTIKNNDVLKNIFTLRDGGTFYIAIPEESVMQIKTGETHDHNTIENGKPTSGALLNDITNRLKKILDKLTDIEKNNEYSQYPLITTVVSKPFKMQNEDSKEELYIKLDDTYKELDIASSQEKNIILAERILTKDFFDIASHKEFISSYFNPFTARGFAQLQSFSNYDIAKSIQDTFYDKDGTLLEYKSSNYFNTIEKIAKSYLSHYGNS